MENERPIVIRHKEFSDTLLALVNGCELPAFIIKDTLRCALIQIEYLAEKEFEDEYSKYKEIIGDENNDAGC